MARFRKNEDGVVEEQLRNPETGETIWIKTRLPEVPGTEIPIEGSGQMKQRGKKKRIRQKTEEQYRDYLRSIGEAAQLRDQEAIEMGALEKGMILAGRETDKLGAGLANIGDFLGDVAGMDTTERYLNRQREQAIKDELSEQIEYRGGGAQAFKALPYLLTGYGAGPLTQRVASGTMQQLGRGAAATGRAGKGLLTKGVERMAASPRMGVGQMGRRMKREWTDPLAQRAARLSKQQKTPDPFREGMAGRIGGDTLLGGIESGVHYDQDVWEGLVASSLGRMGGEVLNKSVRRMPDFWDEPERRVINWAEDEGMQLLPGMRTGSAQYQIHEAGFRSEDSWSDAIKAFDRSNERVANEIAYEAMGIPRGQVRYMTPDKLDAHMKSLSAEYEALQNSTFGRISGDEMKALDQHVKRLEAMKGKDNIKNAKAARDAYEEIQRLSTRNPERQIRRDRRGRIVNRIFDGKDYQPLRTNLKDQINKAYANNDRGKGRALQPLLAQLDAGMEKGIMDLPGGEATAAQWKDLNERYAMTKMFIDHGSTTTGKLNMAKLSKHLEATDMERMLRETGGNINNLHMLAKFHDVQKAQAGSGFSRSGTKPLENTGQLTLSQRFLKSPAGSALPFVPSMMMRRYVSGYPSVQGYLGMGLDPVKEGATGLSGRAFLGGNLGRFWDYPGLYTRALGQGTQIYPGLADKGLEGLEWLVGKGEEAQQTIDGLFTKDNEQ